MIWDTILDYFFGFIKGLLDMLPLMDLEVDLSVLNTFLDIVSVCLYFFPWQKVAPLIAIIAMLQLWRVVISIIRVLWELLPLA